MKALIIRVALLAGGLSILMFIIFDQRILIQAGIFIGAFLSVHKIKTYKWNLSAMAQQEPQEKKSGLKRLSGGLNIILSFLILIAAIAVDQWLFMGIAIGLLISVAVILINIITEKVGLTRNEWEGWF